MGTLFIYLFTSLSFLTLRLMLLTAYCPAFFWAWTLFIDFFWFLSGTPARRRPIPVFPKREIRSIFSSLGLSSIS